MKGWRKVLITYHAVDRFIQRVVPGLPHAEAEDLLRQKLIGAQRSGGAFGGGDLWRITSPDAYLVLAPGTGRDRAKLILKTVLMPSQIKQGPLLVDPLEPAIEEDPRTEEHEPRSELLEHWEALGPQGQRVLLMLGRRLALGAQRYGDFPIRTWTKEAAEEALDMAVYLAAELLKEDT